MNKKTLISALALAGMMATGLALPGTAAAHGYEPDRHHHGHKHHAARHYQKHHHKHHKARHREEHRVVEHHHYYEPEPRRVEHRSARDDGSVRVSIDYDFWL